MKNVGLTTTTTKTLAAAELPADAEVAGNSATLAIAAVGKAGSVAEAKAVAGVASAAEVASEDGVAAESEVVVSFKLVSSKINESVQLRRRDEEKKQIILTNIGLLKQGPLSQVCQWSEGMNGQKNRHHNWQSGPEFGLPLPFKLINSLT